MQLKTKLTLAIAGLVLLVVLAVNVVFGINLINQQLNDVYSRADVVAREIFLQMSQQADAQTAAPAGPAAAGDVVDQIWQRLAASPALTTLLNSAIGYNSAIRDVALVRPDRRIVLDSNPQLEGQLQPQRPLMEALLAGSAWKRLQAILWPRAIYNVSLVIQVGGKPLGTVEVGVDSVLLHQTVLARIQQAALYGLLILLLATGAAWILADLLLSPLSAISAQLDRVSAAAAATPRARDVLGQVQSKIERLGQEMQDVRQVYSTLQENVGHVLAGVDEGLLLFDSSGRSVLASAATPRLLGRLGQDLAGRTVEELFPGSEGLDRTVRLAVREGVALAPRELTPAGGGRPLWVRLDPVNDRQGAAGALLALRDAEPVSRLENELEVARRLSAVGRLTRGVAHEVKNPLNAMAIHLDLLREKAGASRDGLTPHIQIIGREIERLDRVVRTFLDFTRPVELQLAAADLSEVAQGVAQLMQAEADRQGARIRLQAPQPGPPVWVDRDLAEQALLNLVTNGLQAMQQQPGSELRLEVWRQGQEGLVRVADEGPGVAPEHRDHIFDLYFTTRGEGTGIGLSLAARIMQLHHGAIELEPSGNRGASFLLRFPLRRVAAAVEVEA